MSSIPRTTSIVTALVAVVLATVLETGMPARVAQGAATDASAIGACPAPAPTRGWVGAIGRWIALACPVTRALPTADGPPSLEQLIGQKLIVRMSGTSPSAALLRRIERGQIGGVVLLASNVRDRRQLRTLTRRLQRAARAGGQPPLLIAVDQEGAGLKRIRGLPRR